MLHDGIAGEWTPPRTRSIPVLFPDTALPRLADELPMASLIEQMAGDRHATPQGLAATRRYIQLTGLKGGHCHATDR